MRASLRLPGLILLLVLLGTGFWSTRGASYSRFAGSPACDDCHSGFGSYSAPLHSRHLQMTTKCNLCHVSSGDNPRMSSSGGGVGCTGCHTAEGLRLHHVDAGAPPDAGGKYCYSCHPGDATPPGEGTPPPYYGSSSVKLTSPCEVSPALGGEDYDGDGRGLDNDGDLIYDREDPDCATPVRTGTWGMIKARYR